jgi:hypothetical protein
MASENVIIDVPVIGCKVFGCLRSNNVEEGCESCCELCSHNGPTMHTEKCTLNQMKPVGDETVEFKVIKIRLPSLEVNKNNAHVTVNVFRNVPKWIIENLMFLVKTYFKVGSHIVNFGDNNTGNIFYSKIFGNASSALIQGTLKKLRDDMVEFIAKYPEVVKYIDKKRYYRGRAPACHMDLGTKCLAEQFTIMSRIEGKQFDIAIT